MEVLWRCWSKRWIWGWDRREQPCRGHAFRGRRHHSLFDHNMKECVASSRHRSKHGSFANVWSIPSQNRWQQHPWQFDYNSIFQWRMWWSNCQMWTWCHKILEYVFEDMNWWDRHRWGCNWNIQQIHPFRFQNIRDGICRKVDKQGMIDMLLWRIHPIQHRCSDESKKIRIQNLRNDNHRKIGTVGIGKKQRLTFSISVEVEFSVFKIGELVVVCRNFGEAFRAWIEFAAAKIPINKAKKNKAFIFS